VKAPCDDNETLNCKGVPWAHTPYVGEEQGECAQSGTRFGSFGADASRSAWRISMDYVLYPEASAGVVMYDRQGRPDPNLKFGAQTFLNRIVAQYSSSSICDGGVAGDCFANTSSPYRMAYAYDVDKLNATNVTCANVPNKPESWWAGFMAYPTFAAFVAPYDKIGPVQMANWMDTFSSICNFSKVDTWNYSLGEKPKGAICLTSYFESSQAVIATMIMSGNLTTIFPKKEQEIVAVLKDDVDELGLLPAAAQSTPWFHLGCLACLATASAAALVAVRKANYGALGVTGVQWHPRRVVRASQVTLWEFVYSGKPDDEQLLVMADQPEDA